VNDTSKFNVKSDDEAEISLADIVEFIQESWKQLILAGVVGAVLGFGGWFFLGSYKAKLIVAGLTLPWHHLSLKRLAIHDGQVNEGWSK
jgi:hypothetical protein